MSKLKLNQQPVPPKHVFDYYGKQFKFLGTEKLDFGNRLVLYRYHFQRKNGDETRICTQWKE